MKIVDKKKFIRGISVIIIGLAVIIAMISGLVSLFSKKGEDNAQAKQEGQNIVTAFNQTSVVNANSEVLNEWNLKLVNKDNSVDKGYVPELVEIDDGKMFDKRAISYLKDMLNAIRKKGITNIWV